MWRGGRRHISDALRRVLSSFLFVLSYLIKYVHNSIISDFRIFGIHRVIFSCDQAALRTLISVCPSVCLPVCLSVCHTFLTMFLSSYHPEIFRSYYHWQTRCPYKRSRSEVKGQGHRGHDPFSRFRTVTPVWIHIWRWNDAQSLMLLRRGTLLLRMTLTIHQISRSHG